MKLLLRAEYVKSMVELQDWCRRLHFEGTHRCDPMRRYAIGIYQIHQAIDWLGTDSEYESWAAAAIHVIAAAEAFDIPTEQSLQGFRLVTDLPCRGRTYQGLLYGISKLQGQLVYATNPATIRRRSRFNKSVAADAVANVVIDLLGQIPREARGSAIYKAMEIMTGEL